MPSAPRPPNLLQRSSNEEYGEMRVDQRILSMASKPDSFPFEIASNEQMLTFHAPSMSRLSASHDMR